MMAIKERYRSKTTKQALAHLAEELSEAATAAAKSLRWGLESVNPELPPEDQESNLAWLRREIRDVAEAYRALAYFVCGEDLLVPDEMEADLGFATTEPKACPHGYKDWDECPDCRH